MSECWRVGIECVLTGAKPIITHRTCFENVSAICERECCAVQGVWCAFVKEEIVLRFKVRKYVQCEGSMCSVREVCVRGGV